MTTLALFSLALLPQPAAPAVPQGQVWVVSATPGPGIDAAQIDDALALASDGDLILVKAGGSFEPFTVDGLSVTIQGDPGATVMPDFQDPLHPVPVTVRNLGPQQSVTISDIALFQFGHVNPGLRLENNQGPILVENMFLDFLGGATGAEITDSAHVAFTECFFQIKALDPDGIAAQDAAGIDALRSSVSIYNSLVNAASGFSSAEPPGGGFVFPSPGSPGIRLRGSTLQMVSSEVQGGQGGHTLIGCTASADGGAGVLIDDDLGVPSTVRTQASFAVGGGGGVVILGCGASHGQDGQDFELISGSIQTIAPTPRALVLESLTEPSSTLELSLHGQVGDAMFLITGTQSIPGVFLPGPDVLLHVLPDLIVPLGTMTSSAEAISLPTPALPPGIDFIGVPMQALFATPSEAFLTFPNQALITSH